MASTVRRVRPGSALLGALFVLVGLWGLSGGDARALRWLVVVGVLAAGVIGLVAARPRRP